MRNNSLPDENPDPILGIYQYMQVFGVSYMEAIQDPPDARTKLLEIHSIKKEEEERERKKQERQKNRK